MQLLGLFREPDRDVDRIVELIRLEPSLTAEVLNRCNSAVFGRGESATDVFEAVSRLGFYEIYCLVLALVSSQLTFLSYGTTARSARFFGSGDRDAAVGEGLAIWSDCDSLL